MPPDQFPVMRSRIIAAAVILLLIAVIAAALRWVSSSKPEPKPTPLPSPFVKVSNGHFVLQGEPYYFVGTNFWQGMNLGVDGPGGDRLRLAAELDQLQQLGIKNLRIMAASEGPDSQPYRMVPALMTSPGIYNQSVLDGLDYFLAQLSQRGMKAVMVLNNYWYWSGGMAQYVSWNDGTPIPYPGNWSEFMAYSAEFYSCVNCQDWYRQHIAMLVDHTNPYTGLKYRDDPAIFAWELANEPRRYPQKWIDETAAYIKSLDPNHMVTTGSEGSPPGEKQNFRQAHAGPGIDYATIHIWPENWGWYDSQSPNSYIVAEAYALAYLKNHASDAAMLGKPMVLEEFGLARDWEPLHDIYNSESPSTYRDRFYAAMYKEVIASISSGGPVAGDNFWAWAGSARPGDAWVGDPPHETPGWYSVYNADASTLAVISAHAKEIAVQMKK